MTWVALRQNRLGISVGLVLLAVLAAFLLPTGLSKLNLFESSGLRACLGAGMEIECQASVSMFIDKYRSLNSIIVWLSFIPAIIGLLLATPIVLEFEHRTYRLAWTQSITKGRWLAINLCFAVLGAMLFSAAMASLMTWWFTPEDKIQGLFENRFNLTGVVPVAYATFSLALALAVGTVSRRIVLTVAVTLIGYFAVWLWVSEGLRPNYIAPVDTVTSIDTAHLLTSRSWVVGGGWLIDGEGNDITPMQLHEMCGDASEFGLVDGTCMEGMGIGYRFVFHPPERFWTFQAIEASIFLSASAVLLGLTVWVVRRRMR